jgi:hypothetical protein
MNELSPAAEAAHAALVLALGRELSAPASVDWARTHVLARRERLGGVAWLRSGELIRRYAPRDIAARWRAEAVAAGELANRQLQALAAIGDAVQRCGLQLFVLKGLPLADRLYGDASARVCCDIDLYVPAAQRATAHQLLADLGWMHWLGQPPYDASYRRTDEAGTLFLEVHSILASEALAHCHLTPDAGTEWSRGQTTFRILDGPLLAIYLAANLAKHATPPLLAYLDLGEVWARLSVNERETAVRRAEKTRLARCLGWALRGVGAIEGAATGKRDALRVLGFHGDRRTSSHAFLRLMWLADRPSDAARILGTWTWPRSLRTSSDAIMPFWGRRMRRSFAGRFHYTRAYEGDSAGR